jgi:hypothetical protein
MSQSNTAPGMKRGRRLLRPVQGRAAARRLPFGGVVVDKPMVCNHRYLRAHGLPHSPGVAAVLLPPRHEPLGSMPWLLSLSALPLIVRH